MVLVFFNGRFFEFSIIELCIAIFLTRTHARALVPSTTSGEREREREREREKEVVGGEAGNFS